MGTIGEYIDRNNKVGSMMYLLKVEEELPLGHPLFTEGHNRTREWFTLDEALNVIKSQKDD
jgi:hypothetical protein